MATELFNREDDVIERLNGFHKSELVTTFTCRSCKKENAQVEEINEGDGMLLKEKTFSLNRERELYDLRFQLVYQITCKYCEKKNFLNLFEVSPDLTNIHIPIIAEDCRFGKIKKHKSGSTGAKARKENEE